MTMIDYTNLYIKNLDSDVTSYDLFKRFRVYGKIISARVMKDTITLKSKGYGFVSFTHMEEAQMALRQMNGALVNTKNIVVTFHEHKKQMNGGAKQQQQQQRPPPPPPSQQQSVMALPSPIHQSYPSPQSISYPNYGFIPEQKVELHIFFFLHKSTNYHYLNIRLPLLHLHLIIHGMKPVFGCITITITTITTTTKV